jgi:hypothetical protein
MNGKVPVGVFVTEAIPRKLLFAAQKLEGRRFNFVTPPGKPHRNVTVRAREIVRVDNDDDHTETYTNYYKIQSRGAGGQLKLCSKSDRYVANGSVVFNSSDNLFQRNVDYALSKGKATRYLKSLVGVLPPQCTLADGFEICLSYHLVEYGPHGHLVCDCVGCCKYWECSHIQARKHLDKELDLVNETLAISEAKLRGRRRTKALPMVGFASTRDDEEGQDDVDMDYVNPNDLIGTRIRVKLNDHREYNGQVGLPRLKPSGTLANGTQQPEVQVWEVRYPSGQYGGDNDESDDEEVEIKRLKEGRARYATWLMNYERGYRLYT